jgi:hypothetical protein
VPRLYLCSASRLRGGIEDWKEITPEPIRRPVKALRKIFEEQAFKINRIMTFGCHSALHKGASEEAWMIRPLMQQTFGVPTSPTVDEGQTEPVVFNWYFYRCAELLAGALQGIFFSLRDISLAQSTLIDRPPLDWATVQAKVLVADKSHGISLWLKSSCDKFELVGDDLEWNGWRAPRWFFMEPFGNAPYDRAQAWERMDEVDTERVLNVVEDQFNRLLVMELEKAVDEAHVELAKHRVEVASVTQSSNKEELATKEPGTRDPAPPQESQPERLSYLAQRGRDYLQVREELGKIKHLARQRGQSVREIRTENPNLLVWTFADSLSPDERELFDHPRRWEAGYAVEVFLAKHYGKSPATMKTWVTAFRRESRQKRPSQKN